MDDFFLLLCLTNKSIIEGSTPFLSWFSFFFSISSSSVWLPQLLAVASFYSLSDFDINQFGSSHPRACLGFPESLYFSKFHTIGRHAPLFRSWDMMAPLKAPDMASPANPWSWALPAFLTHWGQGFSLQPLNISSVDWFIIHWLHQQLLIVSFSLPAHDLIARGIAWLAPSWETWALSPQYLPAQAFSPRFLRFLSFHVVFPNRNDS